MANDPRPTYEELDEFRTVIAMAKAAYRNDRKEWEILNQLIDHPREHVVALRSLVQCLLLELDSEKRDAGDVLEFLTENAATADSRK